MTIVNRNIERHGPATWQAKSLLAEIAELGPDVVCLTEAWEGSAEALGGHAILAAGAAWSTKHNRVWEFSAGQCISPIV